MGRIVVKGGVWKNTEDEILKAAVMKYGMNQWSRISSLLVRKSAKQCKARWYEWLDPSIRKTEWKREEEEKLLHLAKIMPCQWRTIAPMMGRTAAQLLEKYEQLLDAAQQPEAVAAAAAASSSSSGAAAAGAAPLNARDRLKMDDPRRLRPGEIDPLPEAKPARPDPIDMDEDEKEMLSEARARLANTKGKKAKRKAREKQLEEARRLAVLQKQREMKAAGLEQRVNRKRKAEIDYNEEVPLEKKLPGGFYSTAEEDAEHAAKVHQEGFKRIGLQELEGKSRQATEMDERKKDAKRLKLLKETNLPEALLKINQLNDPLQISRRLEMNLPTPQVSDSELSEIAKMTGGNLGAALAGGATPMRAVGGQTPLIRPGAGITARTPMRPDNILRESQNILSIQNTSSSLLGGENTPLHDSDFGGIKPKTSVIATPNALATPMHASAGAGGATPLRQAVPGTPLRDSLGVNAHAPAATSSAAGLSAQQAISASRARAENRRTANKVASSLAALPAPQNQFALVLPDLPKEADNDVEMVEEDAEEAALKAAVRSVEKKEAEWRAESQVIQRGLPRPLVVNLAANIDASDPVQAEIQKELLNLVKYDVAKFPVENQAADKKKQQSSKRAKIPAITRYSETELSSARSLVEQELEASLGRKLSAEDLKELLTSLDLSSWDAHMSDELFVPSAKNFGIASSLPKGQLLEALQQQFELIKSSVQAQSKKASKLEQNLNVTIGGYQSINTKIRTEISQLYVQLVEATRNHSCFEMLASMETSAIPARQHQVHQLYAQQQEKEKEMQKRFQLLSQQVAELK